MSEKKYYAPREVAQIFKVDPKTVTRWSNAGKLGATKTPGGHRRYSVEEVHNLYNSVAEDKNQL
jgi:excisionase family DNA binding protein